MSSLEGSERLFAHARGFGCGRGPTTKTAAKSWLRVMWTSLAAPGLIPSPRHSASRTDCWTSLLGNASMKRLELTGHTAQAMLQQKDWVRSCRSCCLSRMRWLPLTGLSEKPVEKRNKPFWKYEMRSTIHFEYRLRCAMLLYLSTGSHTYARCLLYDHSLRSMLKAEVPHRFKDISSFYLYGTPLLD